MQSIIATWPFSKCGVDAASKFLLEEDDATTAVEMGIKAVEMNPTVTSVGYGGIPNADGKLELDAAIMTSDGRLGAVMALSDYKSAITTARFVMERSPHSILSGEGAKRFAGEHGLMPSMDSLTDHAKFRYSEYMKEKELDDDIGRALQRRISYDDEMPHSDTVGMIVRDKKGHLVAGCATSGMEFKHPGRVGDSPIFGSGLYADKAGAAVATGDGDSMMRFCMTFLAVERMRQGESVDDACKYVINRVLEQDVSCQAAIAAMAADGSTFAACTHQGFTVLHWNDKRPNDLSTTTVHGKGKFQWEHTCI